MSNSKYQEALDRTKEIYEVICDELKSKELTNKTNEDVEVLQELVDKTTWIPVEKKLPPMFVKVLITYEDNNFIPRRSLGYINESHEWIYPLMNNYKYRVIAWMPLPKPYLGSDENDR